LGQHPKPLPLFLFFSDYVSFSHNTDSSRRNELTFKHSKHRSAQGGYNQPGFNRV